MVKLDPGKTWVTVGAAVAAYASLAGAIIWATAVYTRQDSFNTAVLEKLTEMKRSIDLLTNDGISAREFQQWIELMRAKNPSLVIPDPVR